jgi:hypothetical protein
LWAAVKHRKADSEFDATRRIGDNAPRAPKLALYRECMMNRKLHKLLLAGLSAYAFATGETRGYGCFVFKKGVLLAADEPRDFDEHPQLPQRHIHLVAS